MKYHCSVHKVTLVVEPCPELGEGGSRRRYETPPGSYMKGVPRCRLLTTPSPQPGQQGQCRIEERS